MTQPAKLPAAESLTVEFKSDRKRLADRELIEACVCLANTDGGELWLGVEDNGQVTGLHADHQDTTLLPAFIASRTVPPLAVHCTQQQIHGKAVCRIEVPQAQGITGTTDGVYRHRQLDARGQPQCLPMLPYELPSRMSHFGQLDVSAQPVAGATLDDLNPLERERLRQTIQARNGDRALLELDDEALDGALGMTVTVAGQRLPTLTGLLLIGKEPSLQRLVPAHEAAFQVLDHQAVRANEFRRWPLVQLLAWFEETFIPYNPEEELLHGPFRVPIPRVDRSAYREAVANALIHRDYSRLGTVHVQLQHDALVVSNPGGLVHGVRLDNLLVTAPQPRNPKLADAIKRIGLVERSGRGVGLIYRGLLRYGRPEPDYSDSHASLVSLRLSTQPADMAFLKMILDQEANSETLPVDSLICLLALRDHRRLKVADAAQRMQREDAQARACLEALVEAGLAEPHGSTRKNYTLSARVYRKLGSADEYVRQTAFDEVRLEQLVLGYIGSHGRIQRSEVMSLCNLDRGQAWRLLKKMLDKQMLEKQGSGRWSYYVAPEKRA